MDNILFLDTSVGSANKGDDIIMECFNKELANIAKNKFILRLPTHVSSFHWYQVWRNSLAVQKYAKCKLKFAGGTNMLVKDMLTHYPQWNMNWFNCLPFKGLVLVGVGAGAGDNSNWYTRQLYRKVLNRDYFHSMRDNRSKLFVESLGLKALNTGCVTMWMFTEEFCKTIPTQKADSVVFTLTAHEKDERDQHLIDILSRNYDKVYFWPQGDKDYDYLQQFERIDNIEILEASKDAFDQYLTNNDTDYVGTRLHGGIYAMRHRRRAIIIAIDERARGINQSNNLNCIEYNQLAQLEDLINSTFETKIKMDFDAINKWRNQFI